MTLIEASNTNPDDHTMHFAWSRVFEPLLDAHAELIARDITRARANSLRVVLLATPIASGGWPATNCAIAIALEDRLLNRFGDETWVLNPARYQHQSAEGAGMLARHLRTLGARGLFEANGHPTGGDYMRMWERLLRANAIDMAWFAGPREITSVMGAVPRGPMEPIEVWFENEYARDPAFHAWCGESGSEMWLERRRDYVANYGLRGGSAHSLGCHDLWNIVVGLNTQRRARYIVHGDVDPVPVFYDGMLVDPDAALRRVIKGYEQ